jgi:hypothetical protein
MWSRSGPPLISIFSGKYGKKPQPKRTQSMTQENQELPETEPQPYTTILYLVDQYGLESVLSDLADEAEFLAGDEDCPHCAMRFAIISRVLAALADTFVSDEQQLRCPHRQIKRWTIYQSHLLDRSSNTMRWPSTRHGGSPPSLRSCGDELPGTSGILAPTWGAWIRLQPAAGRRLRSVQNQKS